ncbi:MAG: DUF5110 domain-containing protein [Bacteroidales bacterium]|nr:DUF5110 domain-containing protein [Bacteroidales bacterium]
MKFNRFIPALIAGVVAVSCGSNEEKQPENGVTVEVSSTSEDSPRLVRLEVLGDKIIHVSATPEDAFKDPESLIIVPGQADVEYDVHENGDTTIVETSAIKAYVLSSTGEVWFTDKEGKMLLREQVGGGKSFQPVEVDGTHGYSFRQVFESPEDEAFYGLGQHQADEFNYKGKNEELFQYNTKVSVPFIVSNKGYGVLMDSYSMMRFGNPADYKQLGEVFKLYDAQGNEGCLTGTYVPEHGETIVRDEPKLYFEYLIEPKMEKVVNLPEDFVFYNSKVTYEGAIEAAETGDYQFILYYAGYTTVKVGGETVVPERWRTAWNPNAYKFTVHLEAGVKTPIKVEWQPDGWVSYCGLRVYDVVDPVQQAKHQWWSEMTKQMDWYFIAGDDMDEVISGYRTLTGKAPIMPKWAMGYWQSRERYKTSTEMIEALEGFRKRNIPIDNIVMDWSHWREDDWGGHEFDPERFPDPKAMVDSIHDLNGRMMISVWPKFYVETEHYKEFDEKGWMYTKAYEDGVRDWIGTGYLYGFYDAYAPEARELFWNQMYEHYYPLGIDAWWMDASEPNIRDCTNMEYRKALCGPTALGSSTEFFNAYALVNADAIYNGQRGVDPDKRVFLLTRSGFAGLQRYSTATWSGDIATRWEDMKAQISAGLNFAISGIPYWTMDIGGFCVENRYVAAQQEWEKTGKENADYKEWRELNTRWFQFGAFCPLYRAHGQFPFREPWEIAPEGHPAYESIVYYSKLRYRLMPYIYSLAGMTYFEDYTIMRPLVMDFMADANVLNVSDTYMFGPAFMVAPVYEYGARTREIYFPECEGWYDFYTGSYLEGGVRKTVDAPYDRMPLYVRAGSVVPFGPEMQWSDEKPAEVIDLYVYQGADGSFTLYEDENVNYNYEKGAYAMIDFYYDEASKTLKIGERQGEFPGMLKERTFNVIPVSKAGKGAAQSVRYTGEAVEVSLK